MIGTLKTRMTPLKGENRDQEMILRRHTYLVDVASACNHRCELCPRGNMRESDRFEGMIDVGLFKEIVRKIARTHPRAMVFLYNWG